MWSHRSEYNDGMMPRFTEDSSDGLLSEVVIGTGRLGRSLPDHYKIRMSETIVQALDMGAGLHISPTYGRSFHYLKKFRMPKHLRNRLIVKVDIAPEVKPELQIQLARDLFSDVGSFEIQLNGDLRPIRLIQNNKRDEFFDYLDRLKRKFGISKYLLAPLYHDSESLEQFAKGEDMSWAVHCSLVEREFQEGFIERRPGSEELVFLRAFGEGMQYFGQWYSPPVRQKKPSSTLRLQRDSLAELLKNLKIEEDFARLYYSLHHPANSTSVLSISSMSQLHRLIEVLGTARDEALWSSLDDYSRSTANYGRRMVGMFSGPSLGYPANQSFVSITRSCAALRSTEVARFAYGRWFKLRARRPLIPPARLGLRVLRAIVRRLDERAA